MGNFTTHQVVLEHGEISGLRKAVLFQGTAKFGPPPYDLRQFLNASAEIGNGTEALWERLLTHIQVAASWEQLLRDVIKMWAAGDVLPGLKNERDRRKLVKPLMLIVFVRRDDPDKYQEIMECGEILGLRKAVLFQGTPRFGPPSEMGRQQLEAIVTEEALISLLARMFTVSSWEQLFEGTP